jgi:hypothetical protein
VSSNTNTIDVNVAQVAAPKVAAMATTAKAPSATSGPGIRLLRPAPMTLPNAALMSRMGASVPPEVPEPSANHHAMSLAMA